jgi:periplasmic divalent cation tolerance protein
MNTLLVLTNLPDRASAEVLAEQLVRERLAACINILPACRSVYRWQEAIETADEIPLLIKTCEDRYPALEDAIRRQHPYDTPEIIAFPLEHGLPAYLDWVYNETREMPDPTP